MKRIFRAIFRAAGSPVATAIGSGALSAAIQAVTSDGATDPKQIAAAAVAGALIGVANHLRQAPATSKK